MKPFQVEIHVTLTIHDEKDVRRILQEAEEMGEDYGDPGKKELIRRFFISNGTEGLYNACGMDENAFRLDFPQ